MSVAQNMQVGVIAAFLEGIVLQPTIYWKNARALALPFTFNPAVLYRGTGTAILNECQMMAVQCGATGYAHVLLSQHASPSLLSREQKEISCSFVGGMMSAITGSPLELVMIQQQRYGTSAFHVMWKVMQEYGWGLRGVFRGFGASFGRESIYVTSMLGFTPILQRYFQREFEMGTHTACYSASMVGGAGAALISHPFDIIKTCQQGDLQQSTYRGLVHTAKSLYKQQGLSRFSSGLLWRTANIIGTVWICNECMNFLPGVLFEECSTNEIS